MRNLFRLIICLNLIFFITLVGKTQETKSSKFYVTSDIAPLRKVIVLAPGKDVVRQSYQLYSDFFYLGLSYDDGMINQHQEMVRILEKNGVEVLNVIDLLEEAISASRREDKLEQSLQEIFPSAFPLIKEKIESIDALSLLGRKDMFYYHHDEEGRFRPLIRPSTWYFYTRDFAVTTPKGIIITNSKERSRRLEHIIGRFMFTFSEKLKDYKIAFDAEKEGVRCEGGDILVKDENTILMGINNFSDAEAAKKMAQTLNMDVIGVSMPPYKDFSGINIEIMHLDTVFNLVDKYKALTVPYLFEKKYAQNNPIVKTLKGINEGLKAERKKAKEESDYPFSLEKAIKYIPQVGWLTHFKAGSGEAVELNKKLVDYLIDLGYEIVWVGGERGNLREDKYLLERVLYEQSLQAANVVQLAPGKVLSYAHNKYTIQALRNKGIAVLSFEGKYLADNLGGPHCLTMPLERR
jgi:arginine deiminase